MASFSEADLEIARDRFYPDWWRHLTRARTVTDMPLYIVTCRNREDAALAWASKPRFLEADVEVVEPEAQAVLASDERGGERR
jgi:hypothetical protein